MGSVANFSFMCGKRGGQLTCRAKDLTAALAAARRLLKQDLSEVGKGEAGLTRIVLLDLLDSLSAFMRHED